MARLRVDRTGCQAVWTGDVVRHRPKSLHLSHIARVPSPALFPEHGSYYSRLPIPMQAKGPFELRQGGRFVTGLLVPMKDFSRAAV
jgi:hypothetical protein